MGRPHWFLSSLGVAATGFQGFPEVGPHLSTCGGGESAPVLICMDAARWQSHPTAAHPTLSLPALLLIQPLNRINRLMKFVEVSLWIYLIYFKVNSKISRPGMRWSGFVNFLINCIFSFFWPGFSSLSWLFSRSTEFNQTRITWLGGFSRLWWKFAGNDSTIVFRAVSLISSEWGILFQWKFLGLSLLPEC